MYISQGQTCTHTVEKGRRAAVEVELHIPEILDRNILELSLMTFLLEFHMSTTRCLGQSFKVQQQKSVK